MCEQVYGLLLRDIGGGAPTRSARENSLLIARKTLTFGVTVPQINSPRLVPRPHYSARPIRFEDTQAKCIDRESLGTRRTGTKQGRSLYQPEKTADITRSRPPLVSPEIPVVASRNVGLFVFFSG